MRALIVYESIFGNTQAVAQAIARGLSTKIDVELVEVASAPHTVTADLLIVGGPTHGFTMSRAASREDARRRAAEAHVAVTSLRGGIREWLATLERAEARAFTAAFDTVVDIKWMPSGSAARKAAVLLRRLGFTEVTTPAHFKVQGTSGPVVDGELVRAEEWGIDLAARLVDVTGMRASHAEPAQR